jgi:cellulose synthase/poly-beta-1,6-N-acetylglucosamine synthase-like glycosyltransferase
LIWVLQVAFWTAAAVIAYSYALYPAILAVVARLHPAPPVHRGAITPDVTLAIVAHNEEGSIETKLRNCLSLDYPKERLEIVVVSDGSTDRTEEIVGGFAGAGVRLLVLAENAGKARAINAVVPTCRGEILVFCDARQRLAPDSVRELVACFADPTVGGVSGELHLESKTGTAAGEGLGAYWTYEKFIRRTQSRLDSMVGATGALYAIRRSLFRPLDIRLILDDVAIPMDVVLAGFRVIFEPSAKVYDEASATPQREFRRKVRTLSGNYQLAALRPELLDPRRNRLFVQFVSHKLSRLAVPWCLLALFLTSFPLAFHLEGFYETALFSQIAFYLMAVAGWTLERLKIRVSLLSVPYAFALLNLAAASSPFSFLLGKERAAWKATTS